MKEFLQFDDFHLKMFYNINFGILGFTEKELYEIQMIFNEEDAIYLTSINAITENKIPLDLILVKKSEVKIYESFLNSVNIPSISEDWLEECFIRKQFVAPENYLVNNRRNPENIRTQQMKEIFPYEQMLNKKISEIDYFDENYDFFSKSIFYLLDFTEKYEKLIRKFINAGNGIYLKEFLPNITHVIVEFGFLYEDDFKEFTKYNTAVHFVSPLWLKDSFHFKTKLNESDYKVKPSAFRENNSKFIFNEMNKSNNNPSNLFTRSLTNFNNSQKEIINKNKKVQKKETQICIKSFLFNNIHFHIENQHSKMLKAYRIKIMENSGKFVEKIEENKHEIYYVLPDSSENKKIFEKNLKNFKHIRHISFRWIDYCLEKRCILLENDMNKLSLIYLMPFCHKMPLSDFLNVEIYVCGFQIHEKSVLNEILKIFGAKIQYNKFLNLKLLLN